MLPYILLSVWVMSIILFQENKNSDKMNRIFYYISILLFIFFYSIREDIGYDYGLYKSIIQNNIQVAYLLKGEVLSALLMEGAYMLEDYRYFFFFVAIISIPLYFYSIKTYSDLKNKWAWSVLAFLGLPIGLVQTLSVSRQFVAIAIILFATRYILKRNLIKYVICIIIAAMFHISSLFAIMYYIVSSEKYKYKYFIWIIFIFIFIFIFKNYLVILFPDKAFYLDVVDWNEINGLSQILLYCLFSLIFIYLKKYIKIKDNYEKMLKIYIWSSMIALLFSFNTGILGIRLGMPGLSYIFILLPYIFEVINKKQRYIVKIMIYFLFLVLYIYNLYITTLEAYIPYKSFLF